VFAQPATPLEPPNKCTLEQGCTTVAYTVPLIWTRRFKHEIALRIRLARESEDEKHTERSKKKEQCVLLETPVVSS
jgi:hypothetical protein